MNTFDNQPIKLLIYKKTTLTMLACLALAGTTYAANAEKGIENKNLLKDKQSKEVVEDCYYSIFVMNSKGEYIGKFYEATVYRSSKQSCEDYVAEIAGDIAKQYPEDYSLKITSEYGN